MVLPERLRERQATDGRFGDGSRPLRGRAHRPPREPHSADQTTKECLPLAEGEELELGLEEFGGLPLGLNSCLKAQGTKALQTSSMEALDQSEGSHRSNVLSSVNYAIWASKHESKQAH